MILFKKNLKIIKLFVIPTILVVFWISFSLLFNNVFGFSVLIYDQSSEKNIEKTQRSLIKRDKIKGEFKASENYLGLIFLRFEKFNKVNYEGEDILSFKLKEKGDENWHVENNYRVGQFERNLLFPFGFEIIRESRNKEYEFEIISLNGTGENSVRLSASEPVLQSAYKYPKQEIFMNISSLVDFLFKKIYTFLTNRDFILSSLLYALPFFFYIFWLLSKRRLNLTKKLLFYLVFLFMLLDSFLILNVYSGIIFSVLGLWVLVLFLYKFDYSVTLLLALSAILVSLSVIVLGMENALEKLSIYIYFLMVLGVVQILFELRRQPKNRIGVETFLKEIVRIK